ncbi:hypothetical protein OIV83_002204 [Microbotryomycetes sp. JL201]|nr:hypothetical protein OIV83_002204 [Microbotryomycetes sp. JL201]
MDELYGIESTAFEGKRLVALQPIKAGAVLFSESALLHFRLGNTNEVLSLQTLMSALSQLTTQDRAVFDKLSNSFKARANLQPKAGSTLEGHWNDRVALDAYGKFLTNKYKGGMADYSIYPTFARMNNSCLPNCEYEHDVLHCTMTVKSLRDIKPGEPLTVTEIDMLMPAAERQKLFQHHFNFTCRCQPKQALIESDFRRQRLNKIEELFHLWMQGPDIECKVTGIEVLREGYACLDPGGWAEQEGFGPRHSYVYRSHGHMYLTFADFAIDPTKHQAWNTRADPLDPAEGQSKGNPDGSKKRRKKKKRSAASSSKAGEEATTMKTSASTTLLNFVGFPGRILNRPRPDLHRRSQPQNYTFYYVIDASERGGDDSSSGTLTPATGIATPRLTEIENVEPIAVPGDEPGSQSNEQGKIVGEGSARQDMSTGDPALSELRLPLVDMSVPASPSQVELESPDRMYRAEQALLLAGDTDDDNLTILETRDEQHKMPDFQSDLESASGWHTVTTESWPAEPLIEPHPTKPNVTSKNVVIPSSILLPPSPPDSPPQTRTSATKPLEDEKRAGSPVPAWRRRLTDEEEPKKGGSMSMNRDFMSAKIRFTTQSSALPQKLKSPSPRVLRQN